MAESFKTIAKQTEGLYKDKGSKFLSFAIPVRTEDEVKEVLQQYRKQFFDARHVCYAYILGADRDQTRANDDGEPSGTAGRPILGQINSMELTNILVIVVRYFGGILLGTGGLIVAYKEATQDALQQAELLEIEVKAQHRVRYTYELTQTVMRYIKDAKAQQLQTDYDNTHCTLLFEVALAQEQQLLAKFEELYGAIIIKEDEVGS